MKSKIFFIHIRKTAGTSARKALKDIFQIENECIIRSEWELKAKIPAEDRVKYLESFDFISGHFTSSYSNFINIMKSVLFIRDPVARVISAYNHIQADSTDPLHQFSIGKSLEECLETEELIEEMSNSQTRYLVGNSGYDYNELDDNARIQIAKDFLGKVDFLGLTEAFSTSISLFAIMAGKDIPDSFPVLNKKITEKGSKKSDLIGYSQLILSKNRLDLEVYEAAKEIFNERVADVLSTYAFYKSINIDPLDFDKVNDQLVSLSINDNIKSYLLASLNFYGTKVHPDIARFFYRLGVECESAGLAKQAGLNFKKAVVRNPSNEIFKKKLALYTMKNICNGK
ncbi:MAG: sulfotransferase family protein [Methylococcaceae bacterium]|nr:sulfotransferase family protein [Methylococcaceae bacterium]